MWGEQWEIITDKSCNLPLCREKLLQLGWAAGEHISWGSQVSHPSFPRSLSPRDKAEIAPCRNFPKEGCSGLCSAGQELEVRRRCAAAQVHSSELRGQGWSWAPTHHSHLHGISSWYSKRKWLLRELKFKSHRVDFTHQGHTDLKFFLPWPWKLIWLLSAQPPENTSLSPCYAEASCKIRIEASSFSLSSTSPGFANHFQRMFSCLNSRAQSSSTN